MTLNPPTEDIKDFLRTDTPLDSGALTFGTNLFIGLEPTDPDTVITLYDTGGFDRASGSDYQKPTIQVRSRAGRGGYLAAYSNLKQVCDYLHSAMGGNILNREINGCRYIAIWQEGEIISIGLDDTNRPILTANFRIHRTPI